jgi:hypothetical protein
VIELLPLLKESVLATLAELREAKIVIGKRLKESTYVFETLDKDYKAGSGSILFNRRLYAQREMEAFRVSFQLIEGKIEETEALERRDEMKKTF